MRKGAQGPGPEEGPVDENGAGRKHWACRVPNHMSSWAVLLSGSPVPVNAFLSACLSVLNLEHWCVFFVPW